MVLGFISFLVQTMKPSGSDDVTWGGVDISADKLCYLLPFKEVDTKAPFLSDVQILLELYTPSR